MKKYKGDKDGLKLINGEVYHVISRTVGETVVFDKKDDFYRGVFSIYEFNNNNPVSIFKRREARKVFKKRRRQTSSKTAWISELESDKRDKFVEVWAFSFMPNHIHLILKQLKDNGISNYMKKVNGGLAKYFNEKYGRKGHLFNKFKAVHITDDNQLKIDFVYVHTNLISLIEPNWKEKGIKDIKKVREFLENNKKHSYPDYIGKNNFSSVTNREFLLEIMGGIDGCKEAIENWLIHKKEIRGFDDIFVPNE